MRDFHVGRSAVYAENAIAATPHPTATRVAIDVLRSGGNAVDAAIAACAVLCVVEPYETGVGGDCFALYAPKGGTPIALNGSGHAPAAAEYQWYADRKITRIDPTSPHAVTVPGAVDAWCRLHADYGTKPLEELLMPAINAAENGFLVTPRVAWDWPVYGGRLRADPDAVATLLPGNRAPSVGERFQQPALATTLRRIARYGRDGFYAGPVAEEIVTKLASLGGLHHLNDLAAQRCEYVPTIASDYRGYSVVELPPNSQGVTALIILNVLAGFDFAAATEADRIHLLAEATKMAFLHRNASVGDPRFEAGFIDAALSATETNRMRSAIRIERASEYSSRSAALHTDTTYLCIVDRDHGAISFTNSLHNGFGSGLMAPRSGVLLHCRGIGFSLEAGHPNAIAGRKRPLHTLCPAMLMKGERTVMPFGLMGGPYQPVGHALLLTSILDFGCDPQEAIELPRSFAFNGELRLEAPIPQSVINDLQSRGHRVTRLKEPFGGAQAILIDYAKGALIGGSESRKDGFALGY